MTLIAFDNFNRADVLSSLGTATTGQPWTIVGGFWGILSNQAVRWNEFLSPHPGFPEGWATVEAQTPNNSVRVRLTNATSYQGPHGLISRFVDTDNYVALTYDLNFPAVALSVWYHGIGGGVIGTVVTLNDGDEIRLDCCGTNVPGVGHTQHYIGYVNDVQVLEYEIPSGTAIHPMGTRAGLYGIDAVIDFGDHHQLWDDFSVYTVPDCPYQSWNCTAAQCFDPGDGSGTYSTLDLCLASGCQATYNCTAGACVDPGDGTGTYLTLAECLGSGCGANPPVTGITTVRFDAGLGNPYYLVAPVVDSGNELRSKVVKSGRVTGKVTNASFQIYGYDVSDPIVTSDLEDGINSETGSLLLSNTTQVAQSARTPVNVPNAVLHTIRVEGDDTGETARDQIHEVVTEVAEQGVRR